MLFRICQACNKRALIIKKRVYNLTLPAGEIMSKNKICKKCYKKIKHMLKDKLV